MENIKKETLVVKYGSSCIDEQNVKSYVKKLGRLIEGYNLVIVSSGSVKIGRGKSSLDLSEPVLAAIGSAELVRMWQSEFQKLGLTSAQVLVTHGDLEEDNRCLADSISEMLECGVIPIVNENDLLSNTEIMKLKTGGDNDGLAAHIAVKLGAKKLILLSSDVEGYLSCGKLKKRLNLNEVNLEDHFGGKHFGKGGILSKIDASRKALIGGVAEVYFAGSNSDYIEVLEKKAGTQFFVKSD